MITIKQLIDLQGNKPSDMIISGSKRNTKLMFHKIDPKRIDINPKYNLEEFEKFQMEHWNNFFVGTLYILSFWYEGKIARFIGCYRLGKSKKDTVIGRQKKPRDRYMFPNMESISFLSEFKNRLYIIWTNPSANYGRWIEDNKYEVHSLRPSDDNSIGFLPTAYYKIRLEYRRLKKLFEFPIDNQEWYLYLSNRSGVYLIQDTLSGEQYIGSAYGENGFWGRWMDYVTKKDGNISLANKDYNNFQFCILWETLTSVHKDRILDVESEMKKNYGTRVHGLNNN